MGARQLPSHCTSGDNQGRRAIDDHPNESPILPGPRMRALEPASSGHAVRDGVRLQWEVFGEGEATIFLLPTWSIVHSRQWKLQVPYLAAHARVLVMDGRGNGGSDR